MCMIMREGVGRKKEATKAVQTTKHNTTQGSTYSHVLMRDEKVGRKKQARSNKQKSKATQHTQHVYTCTSITIQTEHTCIYMYVHTLMQTNLCKYIATLP